jgi:UDP-glucose 4-epimerase
MSDKNNQHTHMKKVLIIGLGFIGKNLYLELKNRGIIADVLSHGPSDFKLDGKYFEGDIRKKEDLWMLSKYSLIYSMAGMTGANEHRPYEDINTNLVGHINIMEACGGAKVIFPSTRLVYGKPVYLPVDEEHPMNPESSYAIAKLAAEYYYRFYGNACILRISNPYGPWHDSSSRHGIINQFIHTAISGKPIQLFGGGKQKRDFLYVGDLCVLLANLCEEFKEGVFNVGGSEAWSLFRAASVVKSFLPCAIESVGWPKAYKTIETGHYIGDCSKIKYATGWMASTDLSEGIEKTIEYYIN